MFFSRSLPRFSSLTLLSLLAILLITACGVSPKEAFVSSNEFSTWESGEEWSVRVTYWPDRLKNSYAEKSRVLEEKWTYRVLEPRKHSGGKQILVTGDGDTRFLLRFDDHPTLRSVGRVRERRESYWKLQRIHSSPTEGGPFLVSNWRPTRPVLWAHPYPNFVEGAHEFNYVRGGRSVQKRLNQKVRKKENWYRIDVVNEPDHQRVTFRWDPADSWWTEARYYYRERLILRAVRIDS